MSLLMEVVLIDIPDVWGMLLSTKWDATVGGQLQIDLSYATIPQRDVTRFILCRELQFPTHVDDLGLLQYLNMLPKLKDSNSLATHLPKEVCILKSHDPKKSSIRRNGCKNLRWSLMFGK